MKITINEYGQASVLAVDGDIDSKTAPEFEKGVRLLTESTSHIILDLTNVEFMSSAGLRVLLMVYRNIKTANGRVVLAGVSEEIRDVMSSTGFISFFSITDKVDEALNLLNRA